MSTQSQSIFTLLFQVKIWFQNHRYKLKKVRHEKGMLEDRASSVAARRVIARDGKRCQVAAASRQLLTPSCVDVRPVIPVSYGLPPHCSHSSSQTAAVEFHQQTSSMTASINTATARSVFCEPQATGRCREQSCWW